VIQLTESQVRESLPWPELVEAIRTTVLDARCESPPRIRFDLRDESTAETGNLLLMPGWQGADVIGLKTVTFWPENQRNNLPSHGANYILIDGRSGAVLALLDGAELTVRRTAAVAALAARSLMRANFECCLVIGTGPVARSLVQAHAALHRFRRIEIYGRERNRAAALINQLQREGVDCSMSDDLETSVREAALISTATSARAPLFDGNWVSPGTHLDLVGSFKPDMREVETQPLEAGIIDLDDISGDLRDLISSPGSRREAELDITVFKAVGFAIPDLAAARTAVHRSAQTPIRAIPAPASTAAGQ
jgi:ornithine cyclodeaminase/alanine dehydrogenase-like protein (mu-crystallin family)